MRYIVYLYIGQIIKGITFILTREKIGVLKTADLTLMLVLYNYLLYSHLGLRFSIDKELPILYYEQKNFEVEEYKNKIMMGILFLQFLISIVCYFIFKDKISYIITILISSLLLSLNETNKIFNRAKQDYKSYSSYTLYYNLLVGIVPFIGAIYFSLYGVIIGYFIVNILFLIIYFPKNLKFELDLKFILIKIKENLNFYLINVIIFSFLNLDKILINNFLTKESLGRYSVGSIFFSFFILLPSGINEVLFPKLIILVKQERLTSKYLDKILNRNMEILYMMILLFLGVIPYFITIFFSKFKNDIFIIQLISINVLYYAVSGILIYIVLAKNKENILLKEILKCLIILILIISVLLINIKKIEIIPIIYSLIYSLLLKKIIEILKKENLIKTNDVFMKYIKKQIKLLILCFLIWYNLKFGIIFLILNLLECYIKNKIYMKYFFKKIKKKLLLYFLVE